jgi:hypothetical protein
VLVIRDPDTRRKLGEWGAMPAATAAVVLLLVTSNEAMVFDEGRVAERMALAAAAFGLVPLARSMSTVRPQGRGARRRSPRPRPV